MALSERGRVLINRNRSHFATRPPAKSLASPPNPRADEDRDVGRGGMIVGPWRISQVVLFKLFARTAERREGLF